MADSEKGKSKENGNDYTMDGTVDIKGRPCLRSEGGRWSACSFIVVFEAFERLAYFGVAPNLVIYLTNKLHQGTVEASNNVTNWYGTIMMTPILGAYIADAHLSRYWTFIFASAIYLLGMMILTLSVSLPSLKPPVCNSLNVEDCKDQTNGVRVAIFFLALYTIALGAGGTKPNISTLGADQFDVYEPKEKAQKLSFFNWWTFAIFYGNLISSTALVYIQDNVSFSVGYVIPTVALAFSIMVFVLGTPFYRHKLPSSVMMAQVLTLFTKQGVTLNRHIGTHFQIPPASLSSFFTIGTLTSIVIYDRYFVPLMKKRTKNPRGITMLQRIGIGQTLHIFIMIMASLIERWRLSVVRDHDLVHEKTTVPLSVFVLLPQFALMGVAEMLVEVGKMEFFYDQASEGMKSLGASFFTTTIGIGNFVSSFLLSTVAKVTRKGGKSGWIENNLNASHLDYYYGFFVVLNVINFILFLVASKFYAYNKEALVNKNEMKKIVAATEMESK